MKGKNLLFSILAFLLGFSTLTFAAPTYQNAPQNDGDGDSQIEKMNRTEAYYDMLRLNKKTGTINPADVVRASQQADKLFKSSAAMDLNWESMGPDNVGGRTRALLFDNQDSDAVTIIAAGVTGGIWKSTNLGLTWHKSNVNNSCLFVSCMIQHENGTIYAGTGDGFDGSFYGTGIYKSTDRENFSVIESTIPDVTSEDKDWAFIYKLALQNNRLLAATNTGLKYTDNDGGEWNTAVYIDSLGNSIELTGVCTEVETSTDGLIAAVIDNKVYTTLSDINSFQLQSSMEEVNDTTIYNPEKLPFKNVGRVELAISESDPNVLYAAMAKIGVGTMLGVYKSKDKGATWKIILPDNTSFEVYQGAGLHANTIEVFPNNPNKVCVGGANLWVGIESDEMGIYDWGTQPYTSGAGLTIPFYVHNMHHEYAFRPGHPETMIIASDGGVSITTDNLSTFRNIMKNYSTTQCNSVAYNQFGKVMTGTMNNGTQYIGDGTNGPTYGREVWTGGANNSGIGGYTEISMINSNVMFLTNPGETQILFRRTEDKGYSFANEFIPESMSSTLNVQPFVMWESFNDELSGDSVTYRATEDLEMGTTVWVPSNNYDYPFPYELPVSLLAGDTLVVQDIVQNIFIIAIRNQIFMTRMALDFTQMPDWWSIADAKGFPSSISISKDGNYAYVGLESGELIRVGNLRYATSYETADKESPYCVVSSATIFEAENQAVTSIALDPQNNEHLIVTLGNYGEENYVYETFTAIEETPDFVSIQGNLPKAPVYSSIIEMNASNKIILGTEFGIYSSENAGEWVYEGGEMGKVPVTMLRQQLMSKSGFTYMTGDVAEPEIYYPGITNTGAIYASTFGRGIWQAQNFVGIDEFTTDKLGAEMQLKVFPNPVQNDAQIEVELISKQNVTAYVFDFSGRMIQVYNLGTLNSGKQLIQLETSQLNTGTYFIRLQAGNETANGSFIKVD